MVWHEFFSAASRVGVVATMDGWMGAECAIRVDSGRKSGEIGQRNFMVVYCLLLLLQRIF